MSENLIVRLHEAISRVKIMIAWLCLAMAMSDRQTDKTTSGNSIFKISNRHIPILDSDIRAVDRKTTIADKTAPGSDSVRVN